MNKEDRNLLEKFIIENDDLENLESLLAHFNIFESIGAVRQELRHSDFLSFLLDPSQNHGIGELFLKNFLKQIVYKADETTFSAIDIDIADLNDAEISREWRNVDILIYSAATNLVCVIENKIKSKEYPKQLELYRKTVSNEFAGLKTIFVYLTPEGDPPSDQNWISYNYTEIANLLETICNTKKSSMGMDIHTLITHYISMLRRHIVSDSEIAKLCVKIYKKHKIALDLIYEHRPDLQLELAEFLKTLINESGKHRIELDQCSKSYVRFAFSDWDKYPEQKAGQGWTQSKRILIFECINSPNSLVLKLVIGPGDQTIRKKIFQCALDNSKVFKGMLNKLYPKWTQIYKKELLKQKAYEDSDIETLSKQIKTKWNEFLEHDFKEIVSRISWS